VIEGGRVIVGDGTVLDRASVVISGDRILSVTEDPVSAPNARWITAEGRTVLPGLIDAHVHLTLDPSISDSASLNAYLTETVPATLRAFLDHGVTTIRSTGDYWPWIGEVKRQIAAGELQGPRLLVSGPTLTAPGGHPVTMCPPNNMFCRSEHRQVQLGTPAEARNAVRRLAAEGVDFLKIVAEIIRQAHREGLEVVGHVAEAEVMVKAAEMGLDGFVHPYMRRPAEETVEELVAVLVQEGIPVTSTLSVMLLYGGQPLDPAFVAGSSTRGWMERAAESLMAPLIEGGVQIVLGSDWCPCMSLIARSHPSVQPGVVTHTEMEMLGWGGLSEEAILAAATRNAARALGLGAFVGTLEPGKFADLVIVSGNPLEDISALRNVEVVVKEGVVVIEN
jgi:enamidase